MKQRKWGAVRDEQGNVINYVMRLGKAQQVTKHSKKKSKTRFRCK